MYDLRLYGRFPTCYWKSGCMEVSLCYIIFLAKNSTQTLTVDGRLATNFKNLSSSPWNLLNIEFCSEADPILMETDLI